MNLRTRSCVYLHSTSSLRVPVGCFHCPPLSSFRTSKVFQTATFFLRSLYFIYFFSHGFDSNSNIPAPFARTDLPLVVSQSNQDPGN